MLFPQVRSGSGKVLFPWKVGPADLCYGEHWEYISQRLSFTFSAKATKVSFSSLHHLLGRKLIEVWEISPKDWSPQEFLILTLVLLTQPLTIHQNCQSVLPPVNGSTCFCFRKVDLRCTVLDLPDSHQIQGGGLFLELVSRSPRKVIVVFNLFIFYFFKGGSDDFQANYILDMKPNPSTEFFFYFGYFHF